MSCLNKVSGQVATVSQSEVVTLPSPDPTPTVTFFNDKDHATRVTYINTAKSQTATYDRLQQFIGQWLEQQNLHADHLRRHQPVLPLTRLQHRMRRVQHHQRLPNAWHRLQLQLHPKQKPANFRKAYATSAPTSPSDTATNAPPATPRPPSSLSTTPSPSTPAATRSTSSRTSIW
ncbi:hypothetical protein K461DRAFT_313784 [Myriangium duriaei CBS 260.36]|uniref:Uncharacterized protein n=1 Tax=Myriangium duriaei CBS 260.36 TaxID=1168546 RepID=A0A9P4MJG2_9PEZI|nr:hypothetical protein K461DRAFT_313784 [Myriangium duriaei CBS 260.36]